MIILTICKRMGLAQIILIWTVNISISTAFDWVAQGCVVVARTAGLNILLSVELAARFSSIDGKGICLRTRNGSCFKGAMQDSEHLKTRSQCDVRKHLTKYLESKKKGR